MGLRPQMQDLMKMSMVDVRKNAEELAIYVLYSGRERRWEFMSCFCRKCYFIVQEILAPGHHVVDICWCRQVHAFTFMVDPGIA